MSAPCRFPCLKSFVIAAHTEKRDSRSIRESKEPWKEPESGRKEWPGIHCASRVLFLKASSEKASPCCPSCWHLWHCAQCPPRPFSGEAQRP